MKYIENSPLVGRVEKGITANITIDGAPMTPMTLVDWTLRCDLPQKINTIDAQRRVGALLDFVEPQTADDHLELGDTDWDFLKPLIELKLLLAFQRHAPVIMDELDDRINRGKTVPRDGS